MKLDRLKTGRSKGTPNKITKESREILFEIVKNEIDNLPALLEQLEPRERAYILVKLMPYVIPKMNTDETSLAEPVIIQVHPDL
jgi:hypothetical protein